MFVFNTEDRRFAYIASYFQREIMGIIQERERAQTNGDALSADVAHHSEAVDSNGCFIFPVEKDLEASMATHSQILYILMHNGLGGGGASTYVGVDISRP